MTEPAQVSASGWGWRPAARLAWALRGLDLSIAPGERVLLLGESGAGKSTFLRALAGVLAPDEGDAEGSLLIDGAAPAPGRAGLVLQDPDSQVILARVGDDVAFGCENLGVVRDEIWSRVRHSLDEVGLRVSLDRSTANLSGGQKQRLALAGVLAMGPGLLLLDEPTANLDPQGVTEVRDAVGRVLDATGATLVVVEHRVAVWQDLVDRVIVLGPDGLIADGSPTAVLDRQGADLASRGIWVPGHPPTRPVRRPRPVAQIELSARALNVGRTHAVLEGVELDVSSARGLAITGPNGSGKSTLGLTLAGLLPPVAGELAASDDLRRGIPPRPWKWRSRDLLTRIGTVFQEPEHQFLAPTVRAELAIGPRALKLPQAEVDARVSDLLERLRLTHLAAANPFTLSGGEKRRLSVATVLATRPRLLVLDEPTFGQDSRTWSELVTILAELIDDGSGLVMMTHDTELVATLADVTLELT
ncbi:MAG: energy-coupling factor ABC transporter ATP-binding protein [Actinobacteria bacterium]|nr:energy-coupling factor ABC transporter ATP-binding protein [Actinomycetota bacterium]